MTPKIGSDFRKGSGAESKIAVPAWPA